MAFVDRNNRAIGQGGAVDLSITGLTKRFGRVTAIDHLTFSVHSGEVLGLLGPNGAGKSTTLLCLAGLLRPSEGEVVLNGHVLGKERGRWISLIPETPDVYPMLTVFEHLVLVARSCRLDATWRKRADQLLERLDLGPQRDKLGEALSKGMRQKLLIAATVLAQTPILALDEPMIGLDPAGQRELRRLLVDLRGEGVAIVLSTHLLESAQALCDQVAILKEGRMLVSGSLTQLLESEHLGNLEALFLEATE